MCTDNASKNRTLKQQGAGKEWEVDECWKWTRYLQFSQMLLWAACGTRFNDIKGVLEYKQFSLLLLNPKTRQCKRSKKCVSFSVAVSLDFIHHSVFYKPNHYVLGAAPIFRLKCLFCWVWQMWQIPIQGPNRTGIFTWRWKQSQLPKRSGFIFRILNDGSSPEKQQYWMWCTIVRIL
jgi:hypothetical protein